MKKILILTANPKDTDNLRLNEEVREIQIGLERARKRDQFEIISRWAVRPDDLRRALLDYEPQIVHFSGHGAGTQGLILEDSAGKMQLVSAQSLARLFKLFQNKVECVLLNACYSEVQAEAICQHIDYVVGMNQAIGDRAAIKFAVGFYDGLGAGRSLEDAFESGCIAMDLESIPESATPILKKRASSLEKVLTTPPSRIFISYKRNAEPDETVALQVFQALSQQYQVFIDQAMLVGTPWAQRIEAELRRADFLIVFLSERAVHSEMVEAEIATAYSLAKEQGGHPLILPVRLDYREPFQYPLSVYLNGINWALWSRNEDTADLIEELRRAMSDDKPLCVYADGTLSISTEQSKADLLQISPQPSLPRPSPSAQPVLLEMPEGTMDSESQFYIERPQDATAIATIEQRGVTLTIKGPRQMGKSSLLIRVIDAAMKVGKQVAFLDFQLFDQNTLTNADIFYRQFCTVLTEQLGIPDRTEEFWQQGAGNNQRCNRYMESYLLKEVSGSLVLAMDEVDRMFDTEFRSDFFGMLRSWHNNRALPTKRIWKQFDLALVTATEPYHLIANLNQSPFNVGEVLLLDDFTPEQVADLNHRHGLPLTRLQASQLMALLHGHPYLVRRSLYLVASQQISPEELFAQAISDRGPFGDHLRYHLFRIYEKKDLVQGFLQAIRNNTCPDERIARLLSAAGLVRREGQIVVPRCQLYADYFREHLHG
ncbi:AAA-like domain-containing protein [Nostoc sp. CHAB 5836]|uniref:AAA-like domain-containing protein n=1 Tax=Nostoc sp. CHAB 5836 TaxID=2780404 RepID=UPI001E5BF619|nr:AAA-like domain-containing protein [Nostoc sp. CHAB 5836]MCC5617411.1 AAA-like domain-containing protein [Nostoc sp. CHAB 5836]